MESGSVPMSVSSLEARALLEAAAEQIEGMASSLNVRVEIDGIGSLANPIVDEVSADVMIADDDVVEQAA